MDVKGQLKDWLKATGKDIAKAVGHQLVSRAVSLAGNEAPADQAMADVFAGILHTQRAS